MDPLPFYADSDGDGHGEAGAALSACEAPPGTVGSADDCDDGNAAIHPDAEEHCDGVDEDCDNIADDDPADGTLYWVDQDQDGFGGAEVRACARPNGSVDNGADCDDSLATVTVTGNVTFGGNESLISVEGLSGLTSIGGELYFYNNDQLPSLTGLEQLQSIGGTLTINGVDALTGLQGLSGLRSLGGGIYVVSTM